jgi:hypothetical protein
MTRLALLVPLAILLLSGCARTSAAGEAPEPLHLYLRLEKSELRPGEAVIAEVFLLNAARNDLLVSPLHHGSLRFWHQIEGGPAATRIEPVYSPKEPLESGDRLERDGLRTRRFLLTRATASPGRHSLQVSYNGDPQGLLGRRWTATSLPATYVVAGEPVLKRDTDGVLLKEDAERLARDHLGRHAEVLETRMLVNEAGFLDWTVRLQTEAGERVVLVNPYLGRVRREVDGAAWERLAPVPDEPPPLRPPRL